MAADDALAPMAEGEGWLILSLAWACLHTTPSSPVQTQSPQRHRNPRQGGIRRAIARLLAAWHNRPARDLTKTTTSRRHGSFPRPRPATCFLVYDAEGSAPSLTAQPYIVPAAEGSVALLTAQPSCGVAHAEGSVALLIAQPYTRRQKQNQKALSLYTGIAAAVNSFGRRVIEQRFHTEEIRGEQVLESRSMPLASSPGEMGSKPERQTGSSACGLIGGGSTRSVFADPSGCEPRRELRVDLRKAALSLHTEDRASRLCGLKRCANMIMPRRFSGRPRRWPRRRLGRPGRAMIAQRPLTVKPLS
jgi:hypothetical protein